MSTLGPTPTLEATDVITAHCEPDGYRVCSLVRSSAGDAVSRSRRLSLGTSAMTAAHSVDPSTPADATEAQQVGKRMDSDVKLRVYRYDGTEDWPWVWELRVGDDHPHVGVAPTWTAALLAGFDARAHAHAP